MERQKKSTGFSRFLRKIHKYIHLTVLTGKSAKVQIAIHQPPFNRENEECRIFLCVTYIDSYGCSYSEATTRSGISFRRHPIGIINL